MGINSQSLPRPRRRYEEHGGAKEGNILISHMSIYRPYHLLLLAGIALLISALIPTEETMDLHVHDTYIVTTRSSFYWALAMLTYLLWGICFLTRKVLLSNTLTWLHVIPTLVVIVLFICLPLFSFHRRYLDLTPWSTFNELEGIKVVLASAAIVFIIAQILLIVNLVGGVFNWLRKK